MTPQPASTTAPPPEARGETTVRLGEELRALFRLHRADGRGRAPGAGEPAAAQGRSAVAQRRMALVRLRRDGARPLTFVGSPLFATSLDDRDSGARFALELFLSDTGAVIARLAMLPGAACAAREIHVAAEVASPEALDRMIDAIDPAFAPLWGESGLGAAQSGAAMREGYLRFAAQVRRGPAETATPTQETSGMNQINQFAAGADPFGDAARRGASAGVAIRRVGARPLSFEGVELGMAMSFVAGAPSWYEINIYRTATQSYVAAVKLFHRDEGRPDVSRAWEFADFGALVQHLETFDPADDVPVEVSPDDPSLTLPDLAANAFAMRAKAADARRQYRALVGEILHELDNAA